MTKVEGLVYRLQDADGDRLEVYIRGPWTGLELGSKPGLMVQTDNLGKQQQVYVEHDKIPELIEALQAVYEQFEGTREGRT